MKPPTSLTRLALVLLALLAAAGTGYVTRGVQQQAITRLGIEELPAAEFFSDPRSFSEVENIRSRLEGLAGRALAEARLRRSGTVRPVNLAARNAGQDSPALAELGRNLAEFRGTGQEFLFIHELLLLLRIEGLHDRWLELYLDTLYRNPTHELIGVFAHDAVELSRKAGREPEVREAFRHLLDIPLEFTARSRVQAASPGPSIVWREGSATGRPLL